MRSNKEIREVNERLQTARRVLVVTGAGISAESGIPTFRGPEGYWKKHPPEELASPEGFRRDPKMVWEWYNYRRRLIAECQPNPGHLAVAEIERRTGECLLITQNVDGLHRRAGSRNLVEIHGNIWGVRPADGGGEAYEDRTIYEEDQLPLCDAKGDLLRPDVVWFGEMLPAHELNRIESYFGGGPIDLCFVIGTSALFPYIVSFAATSRDTGAMVVEINPEPSLPRNLADIVFAKKSGEIMPQLIETPA